jgi:two-component system alkaline phosphatase synthesis response regulator PhoP
MSPDPSSGPKRPSVLLVEDDPETQTELARALTDSGARVVGTGSGEAALALLAEWPAGVVVVSDAIPGMSGLEVARRIHAASPDVPIVLMSERTGEKETEANAIAARLAGVFATLTRPFDRRMLAELVVALVVLSDVVS